MRIISVRRGFASDHSSTSYEFLAVDRPLSREARAQVRALSSRAAPTKRRVSFIYHVEGYDIPGGWEPLLRKHYDVMYSESYDWWTLGFAFNAPEAQQHEIAQYGFEGIDGQGVYVLTYDQRVVVSIFCRLDAGAMAGFETRWGEQYWDEEDDVDDLDIVCEDELLNFLQVPEEHHRMVRTTNVSERTFREVRRRVRPMSSFPTRDSCERVVYSVFAHLNGKWKDHPLPEFTQFR